MKIFDKKILISFIFLLIIIGICIYFLTKESSGDIILQNDFYEQNDITPEATIPKTIIVHIDGEVLNPGIVYLTENSRILDAINASGGLTDVADSSKVNLAYTLKDGQKVHIPSIYDEEVSYITDDAGSNVIVPDNAGKSSLININNASAKDLEALPGIGESTALKIVDYRNKNGSFKTIEDIKNVNGIGESKFNMLKNYICI